MSGRAIIGGGGVGGGWGVKEPQTRRGIAAIIIEKRPELFCLGNEGQAGRASASMNSEGWPFTRTMCPLDAMYADRSMAMPRSAWERGRRVVMPHEKRTRFLR